MSDDLAMMTAPEMLRLFRARKLSPVEVTRATLDRIRRYDAKLVAFRMVAPKEALAAARESEARWMRGRPKGLIDGVPTTIKDQWLTKGWSTLRGSLLTPRKGPWKEDSPQVARLREHGAVLLGKTTMPEQGWKGVTDCALTGISRNPWNPAKTCGGSSGGAAIAAAAGFGALNLGSDGAGSIRMPAGFCGVFGLKGTFARVPAYPYGTLPMCSHSGPLTRTVADGALMYTVLTEPDPRDWLAVPYDARDYRVGLEDGVRGLRIAYSRTLGYAKVDREVAAIVDRAAKAFEDLGAIVEEKDPGFANPYEPFVAYYNAAIAVAYERAGGDKMARYMDPGYVRMAKQGKRYTAKDLLDAWDARHNLGRHMNLFHQRYDILLTPQLPLAAFDAGIEFPPGRGMKSWFDWSPFTYPFNFTMQPAATVPCGLTRAGLPVAIQVVTARYREDLAFRAARAYESIRPFPMPGVSRLGRPARGSAR